MFVLFNKYKGILFIDIVKIGGGVDLEGKKFRIFCNLGRDIILLMLEVEVFSLII